MSSNTENRSGDRLLILGAGGHGAVVADAAEAIGRWSEIAFLDDAYPDLTHLGDWPVVGDTSRVRDLCQKVDAAVVAIGKNDLRMSLIEALERSRIPLATLVHPSACVSRRASVGAATVLLANAVVNARASVGKGCIVNTAATVDHDCVIGDGVHIAPGANLAASVSIGTCSWVGIGSAIREEIKVGRNVVIGAGSAVVRDIADDLVVGGAPAKPIQTSSV